MGPADIPPAPPRARPTDSLDLLAAQARQAREDHLWRRRVRRQRTVAFAAAGVLTTLIAGSLIYTGREGSALTTPSPYTAAPKPSVSATPSPSASPTPTVSAAVAMYGEPRSGLPWHSGSWTGNPVNTDHSNRFGQWRGAPMDFATVYPAYGTWSEIKSSSWAVSDMAGFKGRLAYGLPLLPKNRKGKWEDVTSGRYDYVFTGIARDLVRYGHEDAAIRMGVEANGYWFPWSVTTDNVDEFHAAYRRIHKLMSAVSPDFTFWLDLNCGTVLKGSDNRLAPLWAMYPGDEWVDGISMDHYNRFKLLAADESTWQRAIAPSWAPGLQDGVDFARAHGKGFAVPEWGLDGVQGPGDSPFFMRKMFEFFTTNADVVVFENYFAESDAYIKGGLYGTSQNPKSAKLYRKLWGQQG